MYWETKKNGMTWFIVIFALSCCSVTELELFQGMPKCVCMYIYQVRHDGLTYVFTVKCIHFSKTISTSSLTDTMFCVCVCVIRAPANHSLSRFSVFNVISLLWSSCYSLDLWTYSTYSFCITTALYPLTNISLFLFPAPGNHCSTHCFYVFECFRFQK